MSQILPLPLSVVNAGFSISALSMNRTAHFYATITKPVTLPVTLTF